MLGEFDQVPIVPLSRGHRLIGVIESGFSEGIIVPLHTGYFTGFAANACRHIDIFADLESALRALAGDWSRVGRDLLNLHCSLIHGSSPLSQAFSIFTRKPLYSGVYALGSIAAGDNKLA